MLLLALWPAIARAIQTQPVIPEPVHITLPALVDCLTNYPEVEAFATEVFSNAPIMLKVGCAESHFDPNAKNPHSTARGVYQILIGTWSTFNCVGTTTVASDNIACARKIYDKQGTAPWDASKPVWSTLSTPDHFIPLTE